MSLVFLVWLVTTFIPSIGFVVGGLTVLSLFALTVLCIFSLIEGQAKPLIKFLTYKKTLIGIVLLSCMIPSKESTWYMVGAYGTQKLIDSPAAQEMASDGVDILKQLMAKAKKELAEETPAKK